MRQDQRVRGRDRIRWSEAEIRLEGLRLRQNQRVRDPDRIRWSETEIETDGRILRYG